MHSTLGTTTCKIYFMSAYYNPILKCENQVPDIVPQSFLQVLTITPNIDKSNFSSNPLLCDSYFYLRDIYPHSPITSESYIFLRLSFRFYFSFERKQYSLLWRSFLDAKDYVPYYSLFYLYILQVGKIFIFCRFAVIVYIDNRTSQL